MPDDGSLPGSSFMPQPSPSSEPVSVTTAHHYVWGKVCDGWPLLQSADLSVIEESVPPGAGEVRHFHSRTRQFFYVLSGEATLELDDKAVTFSAGQGVHVPPGVAHRFHNASAAPVRFLVVSSPAVGGDRTEVA
jgi:mannose-6-phosphate isomerase-like protein (cupin superfamily)